MRHPRTSRAAAAGAVQLLVLVGALLCGACGAFLQLQQRGLQGACVVGSAAGAGHLGPSTTQGTLRQWQHQRHQRHSARPGSALTVLRGRSKALEVSDATWRQEVLESEKPVLVFFSAAWCGPCRMVSPVVDEVLAEYGDLLRGVEVCTDENPECVAECKVRSVPTLMLFSKGVAVVTVVGAIPKNALVHSLRKHLAKSAT